MSNIFFTLIERMKTNQLRVVLLLLFLLVSPIAYAGGKELYATKGCVSCHGDAGKKVFILSIKVKNILLICLHSSSKCSINILSLSRSSSRERSKRRIRKSSTQRKQKLIKYISHTKHSCSLSLDTGNINI